MKKRKNILKEAIVLLIAAAMVLSTVAVTADTEKSQKTNTLAIVTNSNDNFQQQISRQEMTSRYTGWVHYHSGYNDNAIGLTAGGTYEAAIRFTPDELTGFCDCKLSVVRFYHHEEGTHSCNLKIYGEGTPTEPGDLIYTQPFDAIGAGWIYKGLCDPVIIDCEQDLWVSIEVTHAAGEYPIGVDAGPAIPEKGDFVYYEGGWDELRNLGLSYNWCIDAYVDCGEEWEDHKMHYPQLPDPYGWDVDFGNWRLGDDWKCSETGPVSDIHFWISWWEDVVLDIPWIHVSIWSNNPGPPSTPRIMLWDRIFYEGEFHVKEPQYGQQGWLWPFCQFMENNHQKYYQINIENICPAFNQTKCEIYWLVIDMPFDQEMIVGWKTTLNPFMDTAVWEPSPGIWQPICEPVDLAFVITGKVCEPGIDVEKEVWDPNTGAWVDADTAATALKLDICTDAKFRIIIHNSGQCCNIYDIIVKDEMEDSLKYKDADPAPDSYRYDPPFHKMEWFFPGPLKPCEKIYINITAHVEGPGCSTDYNYVKVTSSCCCPPWSVSDEDYAYVHAKKGKARELNRPIISILESLPNLFPLLNQLLKLVGLYY